MAEEDKDIQISMDLPEKTDTTSRDKPTAQDAETTLLEWVCHPARRSKKVTYLVSIFIVILVAVVYYATYSIWFTILGFLILTGSLAGFYFPSHYKFTDDGIYVKTTMQTLEKKWTQYRSYYSDKNGVLLSPFARPSRLENFRGIYIKFWNNKEDVMAIVRGKIKRGDK